MAIGILIFLAVTLTIAAGYQLLAGWMTPDADTVRRRLTEEFRDNPNPAPSSPLFKNLDALAFDSVGATLTEAEMAETASVPKAKVDLRQALQTLLDQAQVKLTLGQLALIGVGLQLVLAVAGFVLVGFVGGIAGLVLGGLAPVLYVRRKFQARRERMLAQLPGAFELMARVLRAGHSIPQALQAVTDSFEQPIAGEFSRCQHQQNLGLSPDLAFQEMAQRTSLLEMRIFVMALSIQRQSGGKLSEVLERLAQLIRTRLRLRKQVKVLTAEGRLQGLVLLVLPFLLFCLLFVINRAYALVLFEHPLLLAGTGCSMLVGTLWIRKIVHFEL